MRELQYPLDGEYIIRKKKQLRRQLLEKKNEDGKQLEIKIAVLGGSTTGDIISCLELFLLDGGFSPQFYESEYNRYWEEAMFDNEKLASFAPDMIYIHTTNKNIMSFPQMKDTKEEVEKKLAAEYERFENVWTSLADRYQSIIIQNNMELLDYRILGNADTTDIHGKINYIHQLNAKFHEYARTHEKFFINDILYLAACYGLEKWADPFYWHTFKYAMHINAIPYLADSIVKIIKANYGKTKKVLAVDLDNTLWGGVIGEVGSDSLEMNVETPKGQAYREFQEYIKALGERGILLCICSKNNEEDALDGLRHRSCLLKPEDFVSIRANWEEKSRNIFEISKELNILPDSFVFVDDNPVERDEVEQHIEGIAVPQLSAVESYIKEIERNGYFEMATLSVVDLHRSDMYKANARREEARKAFGNYEDFLLSLNMKAEIKKVGVEQMARVVQLMNKSNQFNLTTLRMTQSELEVIIERENSIALYGAMEDRYGDNGIVSIVLGDIEDEVCHITAFLMSCRVMKRGMELAMLDQLVFVCRKRGVREIRGYYYPTPKNMPAKDFYGSVGFIKISEDEAGNVIWSLPGIISYERKNHVIRVEETI